MQNHKSGVFNGLTKASYLMVIVKWSIFTLFFYAYQSVWMHAVQADVKAGVDKYQAGDYAGAIKEWQPAAEANDPFALFFMGQMYRLGRGVAPDLAQAKYYYERAARLGHVPAQGNLGTLNYFVDSVDRRVEEALKWWRVAAANGDARSQYMLGILHFNGTDAEKDWVQAYAWALLARVGGIAEAQQILDQMDRYLTESQKAEAARQSSALIAPVSIERIKELFPMPEMAAALPASPVIEAAPVDASAAGAEHNQKDGEGGGLVQDQKDVKLAGLTDSVDNWRVQIASYDREDTGQAAWERLQKKYKVVLEGLNHFLVHVDLREKGQFFRLQVGPFTEREDAASLCETLKEAGQSCLVVATPSS